MKLCVVSPYPPELNGIGEYAWNVVHGLAATGRFSAITVLSQKPDTKAPHPFAASRSNGTGHALIEPRQLWERDEPLAAARLARAIRAERPDAVWLNLDFTMFGDSRPANFLGLLAPLVARPGGRPLVVTLHQILEATPPRSIGAKNGAVTHWGLRTATQLLLRADAVCVTLRSYERTLRAHYGARNVHHIPLGAYGALEYLPLPADDEPDDILFFGFAAPFKGLSTLLDAYSLLQRRRPNVSLTIAGTDHKRFPGYLAELQAALHARNGTGPRACVGSARRPRPNCAMCSRGRALWFYPILPPRAPRRCCIAPPPLAGRCWPATCPICAPPPTRKDCWPAMCRRATRAHWPAPSRRCWPTARARPPGRSTTWR